VLGRCRNLYLWVATLSTEVVYRVLLLAFAPATPCTCVDILSIVSDESFGGWVVVGEMHRVASYQVCDKLRLASCEHHGLRLVSMDADWEVCECKVLLDLSLRSIKEVK
jgi:hypothetical protein